LRYPFVAIQKNGMQINTDLFPEQFEPIVKLFEEDNNGTLDLVKIEMNRLFLHGTKCELMLRLSGPYFTVAKIEFEHQRQGNMEELCNILNQLCEHHPEKLGVRIEAVVSAAMINFCRKNGFAPSPIDPSSFEKIIVEEEQKASDEDVLLISKRLLMENREAYEVLAQ